MKPKILDLKRVGEFEDYLDDNYMSYVDDETHKEQVEGIDYINEDEEISEEEE